MTRTVFAMTAAALLTLAVSGTLQAAPIEPVNSAVTAQSNVTPVYWYGHRWYHRGWYGRRCWRGYYGRLHCRW